MFEAQRNESITATGADADGSRTVLRRILRNYYTIWIAYSFAGGFLYGVYPLFLRSRGLSQFEMNSVLATYFAVTFLTDVPTGAFADALGRRRAFMLGCLLRTVAFLIYFFAYHYPMFILAESIDGVGTTFCNGAIDAWGVDALDREGFAGAKDHLFSRISQFMNLGFIGSAIIGAYVANHNIAWPWLLGAPGYFGCCILASVLMRETHRPVARVHVREIWLQVTSRVTAGLRQGFRMRPVLLLSLANAIYFAAWAPYWLEWPQFFNDSYGVGIWVVGWLYALFTVARMAGAEMMIRIGSDKDTRTNRIAVLAVLLAVLLFLAGSLGHRPTPVLWVLFVLNVCMGAIMPMAQSWLNEQIGADERATLLSFNSTFSTMGGSVGLLAAGAIADRSGIQAAWQFSGLLSLAALPCYLALRPKVPSGAPVTPPVNG